MTTVRPSTQPSSRNRYTKPAVQSFQTESEPDPAPKKPIVGSLLTCCARAASGHAAAPPSSVMNSRRHLVGEREQLLWNLEAQRLGGLEVDGQFELRGLLNGEIGRLGSLQDAIDIRS